MHVRKCKTHYRPVMSVFPSFCPPASSSFLPSLRPHVSPYVFFKNWTDLNQIWREDFPGSGNPAILFLSQYTLFLLDQKFHWFYQSMFTYSNYVFALILPTNLLDVGENFLSSYLFSYFLNVIQRVIFVDHIKFLECSTQTHSAHHFSCNWCALWVCGIYLKRCLQ